VGTGKAYTNKRSREDGYSYSIPKSMGRVCARWDLYTIDVDCDKNCYSCRGFEHLARNYRTWKIVEQEKRINYENNGQNNLNREESLVVFD